MLTHPTGLFTGDYIVRPRGCCPLKFLQLDLEHRAASSLALSHISSFFMFGLSFERVFVRVWSKLPCQQLRRWTWCSWRSDRRYVPSVQYKENVAMYTFIPPPPTASEWRILQTSSVQLNEPLTVCQERREWTAEQTGPRISQSSNGFLQLFTRRDRSSVTRQLYRLDKCRSSVANDCPSR